jgi:hypothetical protein
MSGCWATFESSFVNPFIFSPHNRPYSFRVDLYPQFTNFPKEVWDEKRDSNWITYSVVFSPRGNYTYQATAACRRSVVSTFADRCRVVSAADPYSRVLGFLDLSRYFFFQVAPQLYSRDWVDPIPDPLLLRKSGNAGNRAPASGSVGRNSDH